MNGRPYRIAKSGLFDINKTNGCLFDINKTNGCTYMHVWHIYTKTITVFDQKGMVYQTRLCRNRCIFNLNQTYECTYTFVWHIIWNTHSWLWSKIKWSTAQDYAKNDRWMLVINTTNKYTYIFVWCIISHSHYTSWSKLNGWQKICNLVILSDLQREMMRTCVWTKN